MNPKLSNKNITITPKGIGVSIVEYAGWRAYIIGVKINCVSNAIQIAKNISLNTLNQPRTLFSIKFLKERSSIICKSFV